MKYLKRAEVHEILGNTNHSTNEIAITNISLIKVGSYEGDTGFYLIYFDDDENELTDTFHETIKDAMLQAAFEFNIKEYDWVDLEN